MNVKSIVLNIIKENNSDAKTEIYSALQKIVMEKLDERKVQVAKSTINRK